ncbi:MAG: tetratricopeptide repeat protein [Actinobacteria bacterium]|nr:tetratricopeptide repeat protein [Actinomycetota bacterium]
MPGELTPYIPWTQASWRQEGDDEVYRLVPASLVFCDLSGFTALSERLSRLGRIGAEIMSDVLTSVFTALLDDARRRGGDMLKFGGDALLLLFQGPGHARRAVVAAAEMRSTLRRVGRVSTPAGTVRLSMSTGVHSGDVDLFLVHGLHQELVVMGPAATTTLALESAADAGEILLSPQTCAALDQHCVGPVKEGGYLLARRPAPRAEDVAPLPDVAVDAASMLPAAIRHHLLSRAGLAEHRLVTVAFAHLMSPDRLLREGRQGEVSERLASTMAGAQHTLEDHGVTFLGTDVYQHGTKIFACAGAPVASMADEDNVLLAMTEVMAGAREMPVRAGVNQGHAFAGDVGPPYRRTYTVLGDTTNTAARIMAHAEPGQVLAAASAVEGAATLFELQEVAPFAAKGKAAPLRAFVVGAPVGTRGGTDSDQASPFVGRAAERRLLEERIAGLGSGPTGELQLVGDPGAGKTRLLREVESAVPGATWVRVNCGPYAATSAYFPLRELLGRLAGRPGMATIAERLSAQAPEMAVWLPLLAPVLDEAWPTTAEVDELDPAFRAARAHSVLGAAIDAVIDAATVVVIEDAHWMDEASAAALADLRQRPRTSPWLLLTTRRAETLGGYQAPAESRLQLEPLQAGEMTELVRHLARRRGMPAATVELLVDKAAGNPFFLEELLEATSASAEAPPDSVEKLLMSRIDRLEDEARTLVRQASVLGVSFDASVLEAVLEDSGITATRAPVDQLLQREESGNWSFRHALVREVAYGSLSYRDRQMTHRRAALIYEQRRAPAGLLAIHFSRAGMADPAWRHGLVAADEAAAKQAHAEAAGLYRLAIDAALGGAAVEPAQLARAWEALGDSCEVTGRYDEAAAAYRHARRLAPAHRAELMRKEGELRERTCRYVDALRWYRRGMKATDDDACRVRLELAYAGVRFRQGSYAESARWCQGALVAAEELGDERAVAHATYLLHLVHTSTANPERRRFRTRAVEIYERLGDLMGLAKALNNLGIDAYYEGDWTAALGYWHRSRDAMCRVGDVAGTATLDNNIGEILSDRGQFDDAEARFADARAGALSCGYALMATVAAKNLGRLAVRRGQWEEGRQLLERAAADFHAIRSEGLAAETEALLAECDVMSGRPAEALARIAGALARLQPIPAVRAHLERMRGLALLERGDLAGARAALEASLVSVGPEPSYERAMALTGLARVAAEAGDAGAAALARQAEAACAGLGLATGSMVLSGS